MDDLGRLDVEQLLPGVAGHLGELLVGEHHLPPPLDEDAGGGVFHQGAVLLLGIVEFLQGGAPFQGFDPQLPVGLLEFFRSLGNAEFQVVARAPQFRLGKLLGPNS